MADQIKVRSRTGPLLTLALSACRRWDYWAYVFSPAAWSLYVAHYGRPKAHFLIVANISWISSIWCLFEITQLSRGFLYEDVPDTGRLFWIEFRFSLKALALILPAWSLYAWFVVSGSLGTNVMGAGEQTIAGAFRLLMLSGLAVRLRAKRAATLLETFRNIARLCEASSYQRRGDAIFDAGF